MGKIDTSGWKEFRVGDLFDIHPTKAYKCTNAELLDGGGTNVVVNSAYDNGIGGEEKLIVHAVAALYNLISDLRPNWLDNEDTSLTLDISIDGRKAQSCGGLVAMKEEGFTFGLED